MFNLAKNVNTQYTTNVMLLSLNTMACYSYNVALGPVKGDPGSQLRWLEDRLNIAEKRGMAAIIIGHIPPGHQDCNRQWSDRYSILMERYQHIVRH